MTQTNTILNNFTVMTLSVPTSNLNSSFKIANASAFFTSDFKIDVYKFLINMGFLNLYSFKVFCILENEEALPLKRTEFYSDRSINPQQQLLIRYMSKKEFFNLDTFNYLFDDNKENSFEYIFVFDTQNWRNICDLFAITSINISGGSNTKKHILSPLSHRLSLFLICLYGGSNSSNEVNKSFNKNLGKDGKKIADYSTKFNQKHVINLIKSNEYYKNQLLGESPLREQDSSDKKIVITNNVEQVINQEEESNVKLESNKENLNSHPTSGVREFHTSACLLNKEIKEPVPVLSQNLEIINPYSTTTTNSYSKSVLSYYINEVKVIIDKAVDQNEEVKRDAQLQLEESWISLIESKLKDEKYFIERYQGKVLSTVHSVKESLDIMKENNYFKKKFPTLSSYADLNNLEYILITYAICISLYSRFSYNALAIRVGDQILDYIYYNNIIKNEQTEEGSVERENKISREKFKELLGYTDKIETFKLGDFFISVLQNYPHDLFSRKVKLDSYYTNEPYYLEVNKEYIEDLKNSLIVNPNTLPMICLPNPWSENEFGGYLTNKFQREDVITGKDSFNHLVENKESIYESVNYLNSIEFGVNNLMLDYILSDEGSYLLENIKADDDLQRALTLEVAKLYSNSKFYLNTHADFRGRIYTQSFYLSYQGGDLSVSLLNFWKGEPISDEGKIYLYIYGANSHNENNISKCSFNERMEWVNKNYEKIINLDKDLILSAESPFIFTAFCLNMREIHNNPNAIIKTPVFLDATCSGIQHLAGLMKDIELGVNTNLLPQTEDDIPEDIYSYLLNIINEAINNYGKEHIEYNILTFVKLERKHIKAPIMTKVYNVTKYGISRQLQAILKGEDVDSLILEEKEKVTDEISNELEENIKSNKKKTRFICPSNDGSKIFLNQKEIYKMAEIIDDQIFVVFPSLNSIYNYFIDVTKLTIKLDIPLNWIAPSGLHITQRYLKTSKKVVSVNLFGKTKKIVIRKNEQNLNQHKQAQAIIPNIIHSLDASHLINLILSAQKDNFQPIISVHDCFGTLPNKMKNLDFRVKKEFIDLYSQSEFLNNFHHRFIQNIKDNQFDIVEINGKSFVVLDKGRNNRLFDINPKELLEIPQVPQEGNLKLNNIMKSKYMIS